MSTGAYSVADLKIARKLKHPAIPHKVKIRFEAYSDYFAGTPKCVHSIRLYG